jgi:hypothetical protein
MVNDVQVSQVTLAFLEAGPQLEYEAPWRSSIGLTIDHAVLIYLVYNLHLVWLGVVKHVSERYTERLLSRRCRCKQVSVSSCTCSIARDFVSLHLISRLKGGTSAAALLVLVPVL